MIAAKHRTEIDGMRAIAVVAVLLSHFFEALFPNGYLGVDIFFVISGFVITGSLQSRPAEKLSSLLTNFYARRLKRLLPGLLVSLVGATLLISFFNTSPVQYLKSGIFATFGAANIHLYLQSSDYFGEIAGLNPFTHTWSLGVEEQFYFIFPLLFWFGLKARNVAVWIFFGLVLASGIAWYLTLQHNPSAAFYLVFYRFWQIGIGVLAWVLQNKVSVSSNFSLPVKWVALAFILSVVLVPFPLPMNLAAPLVVVGTTALLLFTSSSYVSIPLLETRLATYLGGISYSLYLWHWPIVVTIKWTVGLTPVTAILGISAAFFAAKVSYRFIEKPLRVAKWAATPGREVLLGLGTIFAVASLFAVNGKYLYPHLYLGKTPTMIAMGTPSLMSYEADNGSIWNGSACVLSSNSQVGKSIEMEQCTVGGNLEQADRRVLVIGNSFSASLASAFDLGEAQGTVFVLTSAWGATIVPEIPSRNQWSLAHDDYWQRVVPNLISQLKSGDQVLIVNSMAGLAPEMPADEFRTKLSSLEAGLRRIGSILEFENIGFAVTGTMPLVNESRCTPALSIPQWYAPNGVPCEFISREETIRRNEPVAAVLDQLVNEELLTVIDLFDTFCAGEICEYNNPDGELMYRDMSAHPSVEASIIVRPLVREWLGKLQ